jgi:hypothetical protein
VLEPEAVDLADLLPLDVPADREALELPLEREDDRLGEAGVGDVLRQADVLHLHVAGEADLA